MQLFKFQKSISSEIDKRKTTNNYNPKVIVRADNADKKKSDIEKKIS